MTDRYIILAHHEDCELVIGASLKALSPLPGVHVGRMCTCDPRPVDTDKILKRMFRQIQRVYERALLRHEDSDTKVLLRRMGIQVQDREEEEGQ